MNKRFPILAGVVLILMGTMALACSAAPLLGLGIWHWGPWRLWPFIVVSMGLLLVVPPLMLRDRRGLGMLYIPGVPVLVTGGILLFASVFDAWGVWAWTWPLEVLAVAAGFLLAAIQTRNLWLLIPATIIGANGLLFQFCSITGWWDVWAVAWIVEPLSVGLALLAINFKQPSDVLLAGGVAMCALAGAGLVFSLAIIVLSAFFSVWWLWRWAGPVILILAGTLVLILSVLHRPSLPNLAAE
jgi:hypothetical protein